MNAEKTGELIRGLRKERGITQKQLAELLHVSDKAVSRWETGRGFPDIGHLEDIAEAFGVSVAELLRGERFGTQVTEADVAEASSASLSVARRYVARKTWLNLAVGFMCGVVVLLLVFIHLTSPIYIKNAENALTVETLSDTGVVGVLKDGVAGYEVSTITNPDTHQKYVSVSCYNTLLNHLLRRDPRTIVFLGNEEQIDYAYYYPTDAADQLIWKNDSANEPTGGIVTLPRLVYNYWIRIGVILSLIGMGTCILFRKRYFFDKVIRIALAPIAFTISVVAVLFGRLGEVYNAQYYFSRILLVGISLYSLFVIFLHAYRTRRTKRDSEG